MSTEEYKSNNLVFYLLPIVLIIAIGTPFYVLKIGPDLDRAHNLAIDTLKNLESHKTDCWKLQAIINSGIGTGLWSYDNVEVQMNHLAKTQLEKGECIK